MCECEQTIEELRTLVDEFTEVLQGCQEVLDRCMKLFEEAARLKAQYEIKLENLAEGGDGR